VLNLIYLSYSGLTKSERNDRYNYISVETRSPAVAEIVDRTAYDVLFNDHLDTLPCIYVARV